MTKGFSVRKITLLALFSAAAVAISVFEGMLPLTPLMPPGAKAGLSNIIVMFLAAEVSLPSAIAVAVFKAVFALVTRGATAAAMSLAGGLLSCLVLWLVARSRPFGLVGIGIAGATAHNLAQLAVAILLVGPAIRYYAPIMLLLGILSGIVTALLLKLLTPVMKKLLKATPLASKKGDIL